jgi:tRNA-intron lyase
MLQIEQTKRRGKDIEKYSLFPKLDQFKKEPIDCVCYASPDLVFVHDRAEIEAIWYGGSFGKGTLNRSQPFSEAKRRPKKAANALVNKDVSMIKEEDPTSDSTIEEMKLSSLEIVYLTFFGILRITNDSKFEIPLRTYWKDCLFNSIQQDLGSDVSSYVLDASRRFVYAKSLEQAESALNSISEDYYMFLLHNKFMSLYVAYYYYRNLGWVCRSGILYGVDFMLYNKGPVFTHAVHGVQVTHEVSVNNEKLGTDVSWKDVLSSVRLHHQVKKGWLVCNVSCDLAEKNIKTLWDLYQSPLEPLKLFEVNETPIVRWVPEKTRE